MSDDPALRLFAALTRFRGELDLLGVRLSAVEVADDASGRALRAMCARRVGFGGSSPDPLAAVTVADVPFRVREPW